MAAPSLSRQRRHHLVELLRAAQGTAARDDDLRRGRSDVRSWRSRCARSRSCRCRPRQETVSMAAAAACAAASNAVPHRQHLDGVAALHGRDRVARVDRALEGVGAHHLGDFADLRHVEPGATRGATFLPAAVAGNRWLYWPAMASTCAATFSARPCARLSPSAWSTLATPAICATLRLPLRRHGGRRRAHGCRHRSERLPQTVLRVAPERGVVVFCDDEDGHISFPLVDQGTGQSTPPSGFGLSPKIRLPLPRSCRQSTSPPRRRP